MEQRRKCTKRPIVFEVDQGEVEMPAVASLRSPSDFISVEEGDFKKACLSSDIISVDVEVLLLLLPLDVVSG